MKTIKFFSVAIFAIAAWISFAAQAEDSPVTATDKAITSNKTVNNAGDAGQAGAKTPVSTTPDLHKKSAPSSSAATDSATPKVRGNFGTKEFRIGPEDTIRVTVWRNPELNVTAPVRPDGKISVPLIGDVQAGGLTPEQVAGIIKKKLAMFIREPRVAVILTSMQSHQFISRVRVTGAVRNPKSIPYRQGMTVLDVVLEAGGLNDFASGNRTKLYRKQDGKTVVMKVKLNRILKKGKLETNYQVKPGDIISVPERIF